jgi:hypothetical protein
MSSRLVLVCQATIVDYIGIKYCRQFVFGSLFAHDQSITEKLDNSYSFQYGKYRGRLKFHETEDHGSMENEASIFVGRFCPVIGVSAKSGPTKVSQAPIHHQEPSSNNLINKK